MYILHALLFFLGGRKKNIPFRRQRMEIDSTIPSAEPVHPPITVADDPYVADLLKVADDKIAELSRDNDTLKQEVTGKTEKSNILKKQVSDEFITTIIFYTCTLFSFF